MKRWKRLTTILIALTVAVGLFMAPRPTYAAYGDARFIFNHIVDPWTTITLCDVGPSSPTCNVALIAGHEYQMVVQEATLNHVSFLALTVIDGPGTTWNLDGFSYTTNGGPTPTCTLTDNSTRYSYQCSSTSNNLGSIIFNGFATSASDTIRGRAGLDTPTTNVSNIVFKYNTP